MNKPLTDCATCARLGKKVARLEEEYVEALAILNANALYTDSEKYRRIRTRADEALLKCEAGRLEWKSHRRDHEMAAGAMKPGKS